MAKIVVVTSGKGGVGKTTTSASFATGLAVRGFKTVVIDFDVGLRNLDLIMGCENRIVYDFVDVISGSARLSQALVKDKQLNNLFILPASQTRDKDALTDEGVAEVINELAKQFDYIVCDSPAGIERGAQLAMYHADEAIIVTNPEISSVRDSDRIIGILQSRTKKVEEGTGVVREHLVINRYNAERAERGEMMDINSISNDILKVIVEVLQQEATPLLQSTPAHPAIFAKPLAEQVGLAIQQALTDTPELHRILRLIPIAGSLIENQMHSIGQHIGENLTLSLTTNLTKPQTLTLMYEEIAKSLVQIDVTSPALEKLVSDIIEDSLTSLANQVRIQQWKHQIR